MAKKRTKRVDLSYIAPALRPLAVPIADLKPDPKNAKTHPPASVKAIKASLRRHGQQKNIVIVAGSNVVIAGNGTMAAAKALGWTHLACNPFPDEATARAFALEDNRTAELAPWDAELLQASLEELAGLDLDIDFDEMGFSDAEVDKLIAESSGGGSPEPAADVVEDEPPPPPEKATTAVGDLWIMGGHRLLCGDSTIAADVERLMAGETAALMNTDPPYGIAYKSADSHPIPSKVFEKKQAAGAGPLDHIPVANDDLQGEELQAFLVAAFQRAIDLALRKNAAWYLWHAHKTAREFMDAMEAAGVPARYQIIWNKERLVFGRGQYHWKHEPCFMGWPDGGQPPDFGAGNGERNQTTVWDINGLHPNEREELKHGTPKPIKLFAKPIVKHTKPGEIAYEPFAGTGPQFIAAEQLGRRCYGLELEPIFCDVIVKRWETLTGKKAKRERLKKTPARKAPAKKKTARKKKRAA